MERKRDGLVPVAEVIADLPGPVQAFREADPTAPAAAFPRPLRRLSRRPGS